MKRDRAFKTYRRFFWGVLFTLAALALLKSYSAQPPVKRLASGEVVELNDKWEQRWNEEVGRVEYGYTIPESMGNHVSIVMKTYLKGFELLLEGEPFYSFSDIYGVKGGSRFIIRFPDNCAGKEFVLRIDSWEQSSNRNPVIQAYLGREKEILAKLWQDNMYALLFGVCSFLAGAGLLLMASYLKKHNQGGGHKGLKYLSGFIFVTGIWIVTDSGLLLCMTDQVALVNMVSFVSFFIMPIFLLRFITCMWIKSPLLDVFCRMFLVIAAVYLLNRLSPVVPEYVFLLPDHILCFLSMGIVLRDSWRQLRYQKNGESMKLIAGFAVLCIFAFIAFALFYVNPTYQYPVAYCIGITFFYLILLDMTFSTLYRQMKEASSLDVYKKLAYMDTMAGMENRAAFMEAQERNPSGRDRSYILMDINNLKSINDEHGHFEGDRIIQAAARCILDVFGELGKCYRIGGDEFVVILENNRDETVGQLLSDFEKRVQEENAQRELPLSIAVGYARWQQESDTADELFRRADADMYGKKQQMKQEDRRSGIQTV